MQSFVAAWYAKLRFVTLILQLLRQDSFPLRCLGHGEQNKKATKLRLSQRRWRTQMDQIVQIDLANVSIEFGGVILIALIVWIVLGLFGPAHCLAVLQAPRRAPPEKKESPGDASFGISSCFDSDFATLNILKGWSASSEEKVGEFIWHFCLSVTKMPRSSFVTILVRIARSVMFKDKHVLSTSDLRSFLEHAAEADGQQGGSCRVSGAAQCGGGKHMRPRGSMKRSDPVGDTPVSSFLRLRPNFVQGSSGNASAPKRTDQLHCNRGPGRRTLKTAEKQPKKVTGGSRVKCRGSSRKTAGKTLEACKTGWQRFSLLVGH